MTQDQILEAVFTKQSDAIQQVIKRTCIVEFGVILEVLGDNIVKVGVAVADNAEDVQIMVCTLVSLCSSAVSINIEPVKGDKVLILSPRHFNPKMFAVPEKDADLEPILDPSCQGYTRLSGLALLINQFDYDKHRNNIQLTADGVLTARISYNENDTANVITAKADEEGKMSLDISKDDGDTSLVTVDLDQEGNANLVVNKGKATIKIDSDGNVEINAQGKYTFKNNTTDLKAVVDGLAQELENLVTTGSETTQSTSPATKATIAVWRNTKLNQLLK